MRSRSLSPELSKRDRLAVVGPLDDAGAAGHARRSPRRDRAYRPFGDEALIRELVERVPGLSFAAAFGWMETSGRCRPGRRLRPGWTVTTGVEALLHRGVADRRTPGRASRRTALGGDLGRRRRVAEYRGRCVERARDRVPGRGGDATGCARAGVVAAGLRVRHGRAGQAARAVGLMVDREQRRCDRGLPQAGLHLPRRSPRRSSSPDCGQRVGVTVSVAPGWPGRRLPLGDGGDRWVGSATASATGWWSGTAAG